LELDDQLCYCFHVTKRKVVNYIRIHQPRVPSQLSECGGAGTGCGWCVPFLKKCFEADAARVQREPDEDRAKQDEQHPGLSDGGKEPRNQQGSVDVGLIQFQTCVQVDVPFRDGERRLRRRRRGRAAGCSSVLSWT